MVMVDDGVAHGRADEPIHGGVHGPSQDRSNPNPRAIHTTPPWMCQWAPVHRRTYDRHVVDRGGVHGRSWSTVAAFADGPTIEVRFFFRSAILLNQVRRVEDTVKVGFYLSLGGIFTSDQR